MPTSPDQYLIAIIKKADATDRTGVDAMGVNADIRVDRAVSNGLIDELVSCA